MISQSRESAADLLGDAVGELSAEQRKVLLNFAVDIDKLGRILQEQGDPGCVSNFTEALGLYQRMGARIEEANLSVDLGNVYSIMPGVRDLDQAEYWHRHALNLREPGDLTGRAKGVAQLAEVDYERFLDSVSASSPDTVQLEHFNAALSGYREALDLFPAYDHEDLAVVHNQLGRLYSHTTDTRESLREFQQAIWHEEICGNIYHAGMTRYLIAQMLRNNSRADDALLYARAALNNFDDTGQGAAEIASRVRQLIAAIEQHGA